MTFFQMQEIGSVGGNPCGGFTIDGATYNSGTPFENGKFDDKWGNLYEKGIAKFGKIEKPIYVYYDCSQSKVTGSRAEHEDLTKHSQFL